MASKILHQRTVKEASAHNARLQTVTFCVKDAKNKQRNFSAKCYHFMACKNKYRGQPKDRRQMKQEEIEKIYASALDRILLAGASNLQLVAAIYDEQGKVLMRQKKKHTFGISLFNRLADGKVRACLNNNGKVDDLLGMSNVVDWCKAEMTELLPCILFGADCNVKGAVKYNIGNSIASGYISVSGAATADRDLKAIEDGLEGLVQDSNGVYDLMRAVSA